MVTVREPGGLFNNHPFAAVASVTGANTSSGPGPWSLNVSTFLGGSGNDFGGAVAVDAAGDTYIAGATLSPNFPTTPGAFETTSQSVADRYQAGFVAKFDPSGQLVWSTYLDWAQIQTIAVSSSGNVYVGGSASPGFGTNSGFATTPGAFQTTASSSNNGLTYHGFVAELNSTGSSLIYATYLAGSNNDSVTGIGLDSAGDAYAVGVTQSSDFPTQNAIQPNYAGQGDLFVSELNSTGTGLVFSTFLGGSGSEGAGSIALDSSNNIYVYAATTSTDLPTTANAFQRTAPGPNSEFVAKLNAGGTSLAYLTYLGGGDELAEGNNSLAVDAAGDAYVTGVTSSNNFPTVNAYQSSLSGYQDAFVAELNPSGSALLGSTYFGTDTAGFALALDDAGNVDILGSVYSDALPTVNALQPYQGLDDSFVAQLNLSTGTVSNSTYLGGSGFEADGGGIAVDSSGRVTATGQTESPDFPTVNAYQSEADFLAGQGHTYISSFVPGTPVEEVSGSTTFTYYQGSTVSGTGSATAPTSPGTYTVVANFTSSDPNYTDAQSAPLTFTISPDPPIVGALVYAGPYTGSPHQTETTVYGLDGSSVSGSTTYTYYDGDTVSGPGTTTAPVDAGTYTAVASFTSDDPDYANSVSAPYTFTIAPAIPNVVVNDPSGPYTGQPFAATVTGIGVFNETIPGSATVIYYGGSIIGGTSTPPTEPGTYTAIANFTSDDPNYSSSEGSTSFTISQATPTVTVSDGGAFTGNPFPATVSITGANNTPIQPPLGLNFSTYLGGSGTETALGVAVDAAGNIFVTGATSSPDFPVTPGAYQTSSQSIANGGFAGYVAKFSPSGQLLWATYLDGAVGFSIAVDSNDDVYIGGFANSYFTPTAGAFQTTATAGPSHGFVAELNSTGSALIYGTFLGGSNNDEVNFLTLDSSGDVYMTGITSSPDFPTVNAVQPTYGGDPEDAFVAELNSTGSSLIFSTFLGGNGDDFPGGIALDSQGDVYVDGSTSSTDLETTPGAFQPGYGGGSYVAFVAKYAAGGSSLDYLTYLGGSNLDYGSLGGLVVDSAGDAYVTGQTYSSDFPTTANAYQSTLEGDSAAYITELNPTGTALVYSTYFGGNNDTSGNYIAADSAGNIYIACVTDATNMPTANALQGYAGGNDTYIAELNLSTGTLVNATYLGGSQDEGYFDPIAIDSSGRIIVAGYTDSPDFPTQNAFQPVYGGGDEDAFVASISPGSLPVTYYAGTTASGTPLSGAPTDPGTYTAVASFPGNSEYLSATGSTTFTITQGTPDIVVTDGGTYDGNQFPASATATGGNGAEVNGTLSYTYYAGTSATGAGTSTAPTDAGTYTVVADFASADPNYLNAESAPLTFIINQATPTVDVVDMGGDYTGNPYNATATATGVGGATVNGTFAFTYYVGSTVNGTGSSTAPTNPGTYTVTAAFTSSDPNYTNASGGPVTFLISQTGPAIMVPTAVVLYENGSLTFSTANDNQITLTDGQAVGTSDSLTLSVSHGLLRFGSTTGLKFTSGSNHLSSMTVNGTLANLNTALQTLKYTPTSGYVGADALNLTVSDSINHQSGSASVGLTVYGPPTLSATATAGVNENGTLVFSSANGNAITLADAAASATSDSLVLTATHGTLFLGSTAGLTFTAGANGSASMTISGTLASLSAALNGLEYTPKTGYSGAASLTIKAKDAVSGFNTTATVAITVSIPASQPTVAVTTEFPTAVPGQPVPLVITVTDTNSTAQAADFKLVISFGDGKSATISAAPDSLIVNHVYTKTGTYTVSITATDEYGHSSSAGTTTITVVPVAVEIDPFDPSLTALFVGGTGGKDTVAFTASGNQIAVTLNKVAEGTFSTSGPLIVFGQGGADTVTVGAGVTNTSYLLETPNADNAETDLDDETIQWAGLSSAVEILNE
jgi:hypothetical protein